MSSLYEERCAIQSVNAETKKLQLRAPSGASDTGRFGSPKCSATTAVHAATLLSHTERLVIATGIANIYKRQPIAMAGAARQLVEQFGDSFVLGLGVSNREVNAARGLGFGKPVAEMRDYLVMPDSISTSDARTNFGNDARQVTRNHSRVRQKATGVLERLTIRNVVDRPML
jgi:alkanesulfonate monooxygenase SsuD/methylene tetrahydromethanopterin reductase-like flavin-dependent oxidoreductase (luciferase family)